MSSHKRSHPVSDITPPLRQRNLTCAWIRNPPPSLRDFIKAAEAHSARNDHAAALRAQSVPYATEIKTLLGNRS